MCFCKEVCVRPEIEKKEIVQDLCKVVREIFKFIFFLKAYLFQSVKNRCFTYLTQVENQAKHLEKAAFLEKRGLLLDGRPSGTGGT